MARRCGSWVLVVSLVLSMGGHWAILQVFAWTGMLARYSRDLPVREAVARTFDGEHPCQLCKLVRKGRAEEQSRTTPLVMTRLDLLPSKPACPPILPPGDGQPAAFPLRSPPASRRDAPPVPPPRPA